MAISALAAAAILLTAFYLFTIVLPAATGDVEAQWRVTTIVNEGLMAAVALCAGALALVVLWLAPVTSASAMFSLYLAALAFVSADSGKFVLVDSVLEATGASEATERAVGAALFAAALSCSLAAGLRWSQLFPRRLSVADIRAHVRQPMLAWLQEAMIRRGMAWFTVGIGGFLLFATASLRFRDFTATQLAITLGVPMSVLVLGTLNLSVNHKAGTPSEKYRIYWVLEAGIVASLLSFAAMLVDVAVHVFRVQAPLISWLHAVLLPLSLLSLIGLLAIAALYAGAVDSRLVIRKTILYAATGFVLTAVFVAIEGLASEFLVARLGLPERAGGWLAGIAIALTSGSVKHRLELRLGKIMTGSPVRAPGR